MTDEQKAALLNFHGEFVKFRSALSSESDRGCALYAAAYLDNALGDMLAAGFVQSPKMREDLLENQRPLGTFSSRITMAFYLGKISEAERKDLEIIRKIRNAFAHESDAIDFNSQSIQARCRNLTHTWHTKEERARGHYTAAVSGLLSKIHVRTIQAEAFTNLAHTPVPDQIKIEVQEFAKAFVAAAATRTSAKASTSAPTPEELTGNKAHKLLADFQALARFREMNTTVSSSKWSREREHELQQDLDSRLGLGVWKELLAAKTIGADEEAILSLILHRLAEVK